jgi:hypothetical protein
MRTGVVSGRFVVPKITCKLVLKCGPRAGFIVPKITFKLVLKCGPRAGFIVPKITFKLVLKCGPRELVVLFQKLLLSWF